MIAFVYLIPVIACLLLHLEFDYDGKWTTYLWMMFFGELTAGLLHYVALSIHSSSEEFLGSIVSSIHHEDEWVELIKTQETRRDSNGNSYTVTKIEEKRHPEKYYFFNTRGSRIKTHFNFFNYVASVWNLSPNYDSWTSNNIKGGIRYGRHYTMKDFNEEQHENPHNWIPVTETNSYTNKVRCSNSVFKFEKIDKTRATELGLIDYPTINGYDAPCILSKEFKVSKEADDLFRKFNGAYAPTLQMRLYILLFKEEQGISISELQKAYWQGGNKNEFVICIGLKGNNQVGWARAFSWADEQIKEVEVAQWLTEHPTLDFESLHKFLISHLGGWKRKEFKDFDYINVTLPLWWLIVVFALSIGENALALYITLKDWN